MRDADRRFHRLLQRDLFRGRASRQCGKARKRGPASGPVSNLT
jgi:hypothetical protein